MRQSLFLRSAEIYRTLRKRGKTIRSLADCLIAACVIEESASLLENDADFHTIAEVSLLKPTQLARNRTALRARAIRPMVALARWCTVPSH